MTDACPAASPCDIWTTYGYARIGGTCLHFAGGIIQVNQGKTAVSLVSPYGSLTLDGDVLIMSAPGKQATKRGVAKLTTPRHLASSRLSMRMGIPWRRFQNSRSL